MAKADEPGRHRLGGGDRGDGEGERRECATGQSNLARVSEMRFTARWLSRKTQSSNHHRGQLYVVRHNAGPPTKQSPRSHASLLAAPIVNFSRVILLDT